MLVWDINAARGRSDLSSEVTTSPGSAAESYHVAFSPDGLTYAVGGGTLITLFDAETDRKIKVLSISTDGQKRIQDLAFSPDSRTIAAVSDEDRIALLDVEAGVAFGYLQALKHRFVSVAYCPESGLLATGGAKEGKKYGEEIGVVKLWGSWERLPDGRLSVRDSF